MWMNSGLLVTFDPQIKPITKSECSSAIFTCEDRKRKTDDSQAKLPRRPDVTEDPNSHRSLGVFSGGQRPLRTHLCDEQTASTQRFSHSTQTLDHPWTWHHMSVHNVGPGWDVVCTTWNTTGKWSTILRILTWQDVFVASPLYWWITVFPMSANFRSSKMRKLCCSARACSFWAKSSEKSCQRMITVS